MVLCADFSFQIAEADILPGLIVEVRIIIGNHGIDPRGVDLHQAVYDVLSIIPGNILNQAFINFSNRPIIW